MARDVICGLMRQFSTEDSLVHCKSITGRVCRIAHLSRVPLRNKEAGGEIRQYCVGCSQPEASKSNPFPLFIQATEL